MAVNDDIIAERTWGAVRCGRSAQFSPSVPQLAREFGLLDEPHCYREITEASARRLVHLVLHRDLAYHEEAMPDSRAAELADRFFAPFGPLARYFTNGTFHENPRQARWKPVTDSTFDTGVLVIAPTCSWCLWVEDED